MGCANCTRAGNEYIKDPKQLEDKQMPPIIVADKHFIQYNRDHTKNNRKNSLQESSHLESDILQKHRIDYMS